MQQINVRQAAIMARLIVQGVKLIHYLWDNANLDGPAQESKVTEFLLTIQPAAQAIEDAEDI